MDLPPAEASLPEKKSQLQSFLMSRRALIRAALAVGATALAPGLALGQAIESGITAAARGEDGSKFLSDPNWKAVFLNDHQNETLIVLSEVIIPTTDTPGAKEALVNRFLDLLLSIESTEFQQQFTNALARIDGESQKQFGKDFRLLTSDDQIWLLTPWAYPQRLSHWTRRGENGNERASSSEQSFQLLKSFIASAYYGSEIGAKELGWDGEFTHGPYEGCEHQNNTHS